MNSDMKRIINYIVPVFFLVTVLSCKLEDPEIEFTPIGKMANEWHYQLLIDDGSGNFIDPYNGGYNPMFTTNTAANTPDSMWIDDDGSWAEIRAKVAINVSDMTFSNSTIVTERYTDGTVLISNGKILEGAAKSFSGVTVDSIYFEAEFDWDPGTTYILAGHQRTGFLEDEI